MAILSSDSEKWLKRDVVLLRASYKCCFAPHGFILESSVSFTAFVLCGWYFFIQALLSVELIFFFG